MSTKNQSLNNYILTSENNEYSLFKNKGFYLNKDEYYAVFIQTTNDIAPTIKEEASVQDLSKIIHFIDTIKMDRNFKETFSDNCYGNPISYFLTTKENSLLEISPKSFKMYNSTFSSLNHKELFEEEDLLCLNEEQLKEIILFSSLEQYNLICESKKLHNNTVIKALAIRYLAFFNLGFGSMDDFDFCENLCNGFFDPEMYSEIQQLKSILDLSFFVVEDNTLSLLQNIHNISIPPTDTFINLCKENDIDNDDSLIIISDQNESTYIEHLLNLVLESDMSDSDKKASLESFNMHFKNVEALS